MNICVYCGSMRGNRPIYAQVAEELGHWIAQEGHTLVYGGGGVGLMDVVSDAVLDAGGKAIGIMPEFLAEREASRRELMEFHLTETMAERRTMMIERSDAFVALPGGPGTVEELSEVVSLKKLGRVSGPCVLLNVEGFYDGLLDAYDAQLDCGFATPHERAGLQQAHSVAEFAQIIGSGLEEVS